MNNPTVSEQLVTLVAEESDRGILRERNLDAVLHASIGLGELIIVSDGSGEPTEGTTAARMVVENIFSYLATLPRSYPVETAIREATERVNANLPPAALEPMAPHSRKGATVVLALMQQNAALANAWIGHIGDSRAYLVRGSHMTRLTTDHTAVQSMLNLSLITPEEAPNHPEATVLTRSLGTQPQSGIDIEQLPLAAGDTLLLCSDGLWRAIPEREIERVANNPDLPVKTASHTLLEMALAAGGQDNISLEMARLLSPPESHVDSEPVAVLTPSEAKRHRVIATWFVVALLLIILGMCGLAYFALWG